MKPTGSRKAETNVVKEQQSSLADSFPTSQNASLTFRWDACTLKISNESETLVKARLEIPETAVREEVWEASFARDRFDKIWDEQISEYYAMEGLSCQLQFMTDDCVTREILFQPNLWDDDDILAVLDVFLQTRSYQPAEVIQISNKTDLVNGLKGIICEYFDIHISFLPKFKLPGQPERGCWAMVRNSDNRINWIFQKGDIAEKFFALWISKYGARFGVDISVQYRYGPLREKFTFCRSYQRIFAHISENGSIPLHMPRRLTDEPSEKHIITPPSNPEEALRITLIERLSDVFTKGLGADSYRIFCRNLEGKEGKIYFVVKQQEQTHYDGHAYYTHRLELCHKINGKLAEAFFDSTNGERIFQCLSYLCKDFNWKHCDWVPWVHSGSTFMCEY